MIKESLENLILIGWIEEKGDKGKQRLTYLTELSMYMAELSVGEITKEKIY